MVILNQKLKERFELLRITPQMMMMIGLVVNIVRIMYVAWIPDVDAYNNEAKGGR